MLLPHTAEYALRATLHIAARHPESVPVTELAAAVRAPRNYLSKTLGHLARAGILASSRGRSGGFRLAVDPRELSLARVIAAFSGTPARRCLLGHGPCGHDPQCAVHARWQPVVRRLESFLASTTIADLACSLPSPLLEVSP